MLASGTFRPGFAYVADGRTAYRLVLRRSAPATVTVELPDGQLLSFTDPAIASHWGDTAGVQLRRPKSDDGYAEFTALATETSTSGARFQPVF